jgi:hypothetical protein
MNRNNVPSYEVLSSIDQTKQGVVFTTTGFNLAILIGERGSASQIRYFARPDAKNRTYDVFACLENGRVNFSSLVGFIFTEHTNLVVKVVDATGAQQVYHLRPTRYGRQPARQRAEDRSYLLAH